MNKEIEKHLEEMRKLQIDGISCGNYFNKLKVKEQRDVALAKWSETNNLLHEALDEWEESSDYWDKLVTAKKVFEFMEGVVFGVALSLLIYVLTKVI